MTASAVPFILTTDSLADHRVDPFAEVSAAKITVHWMATP